MSTRPQMASIEKVSNFSGVHDAEADPRNCPTETALILSRKILRSAKYRNEKPFTEVLNMQVDCRYNFALARSVLGEVYDLVLRLKNFDEDLIARDGEGFYEEPITSCYIPPYYWTGCFVTDLSINVEGLVEQLYTSNSELLEIRHRQLQVMEIMKTLITNAQNLQEKLGRLMLHPLHRVLSNSRVDDCDDFSEATDGDEDE